MRYPDNALTRALEGNSSSNASRMGVASATPQPTARSAAVGREVPAQLTDAEREHLDQQARAAGVQDERLGDAGDPNVRYKTMEEAMAVGRPVQTQRQHAEVPSGIGAYSPRTVRLPSFDKVEGIDLERGHIIIDGLDFPLDKKKLTELRLYCVKAVQKLIFKQMTEAAKRLISTTAPKPEVADGGTEPASSNEEVQRDTEGSSEEPSL